MKSVKEKTQKAFNNLKDDLGYKNPMQAPKILKVVVSVGIGSTKDKKKKELIEDRLAKITGQKPVEREAKKSIAAFKLREGDLVGYQVTLRGRVMYDFLDRFLNIALPRTKDFRGISRGVIDEMGNLTIGVKEHIIFPETSDEDIRDVFGLAITIVTSCSNKDEAEKFFEHLGMPFKKK